MESFFASFSNASPITGASPTTNSQDQNNLPPPAYPEHDPLSVLASIRRARAVAAETNAECDPAPPSPARSAQSHGSRHAHSHSNSHHSAVENGGVEVDIDAGPIAYSGGGVAEFLAAREEAENGGKKSKKNKTKWRLGGLLFGASPKSTKTGSTNILDDEGDLAPPPPPDDDDDEGEEEEEGKGQSGTTQRRRRGIAAALLIVLMAVAVAVGVVVGGQNKSGSSSTSSAMAGGSDVPDDFDNVGIPDDFDNVSSGTTTVADDIDNILMGDMDRPASAPVPPPPTLRPPSVAPPTSRPAPTPCASNTYDAGYGCLGRCEAGQKCGAYGYFDAFYPNDGRPCPGMCCRNGRVERGAQDGWYQCCEGVASNLADYQRPGSNVRRSCSPLF